MREGIVVGSGILGIVHQEGGRGNSIATISYQNDKRKYVYIYMVDIRMHRAMRLAPGCCHREAPGVASAWHFLHSRPFAQLSGLDARPIAS